MRARIPVVEILTPTPITIPLNATAAEAANKMRDKDILTAAHRILDGPAVRTE